MIVMKRDGREEAFTRSKIQAAVLAALEETYGTKSSKRNVELSKTIAERLAGRYKKRNRAISVEEIQDDVEVELMKEGEYKTARNYIRYRYSHEFMRNSSSLDNKILALVDGVNEEVIQENSNKNPLVLSTQRDYIAGETSRDITNRLLLPDEISQAHNEGIIHFHDTDYFAQHMFNCCLVNLEDMLQNGTMINGVLVEKPHRFSTACTIATQVMAAVASSQYGFGDLPY